MSIEEDSRVKHFIKEVALLGKVIPLTHTNKALKLVINEMSAEKGYARHDGRDYFMHPIAVAQMALDFQLVQGRIRDGKAADADTLLAVCLLHDAMEDIPWVDKAYLIQTFGEAVYQSVDNVSKRTNEPTKSYLERVKSVEISAVVKILDRMHNVSTLSNSTVKHRRKQLGETRKHYIPLIKDLRRMYFEDSHFYWQARILLKSLTDEVARSLQFEPDETGVISL